MRHVALLGLILAAPAQAADPAWTLAAGGGVSRLGADLDQSYGSAALTRSFGDTYLRGSVTLFAGDDGVGRLRTSAETTQFGLALGHSIGALTLELTGAVGTRSFDDVQVVGPNGQSFTVGGDGDLWSLGGSVSYTAPLASRWTLTPYATLDYSSLDVARSVVAPGGRRGNPFVTREDGVTGAAGVALDREIGAASSIGVQASFVATSNSASVTRAASGAQRLLEGSGASESWVELGASATIGLSSSLALHLAVVQTLGLAPSESATGAATLRLFF
jgi:hypothetical protein